MLQYILALITIIVFVVLIVRKPQVETYILFVLTVLPLMDTKILPLEYGFIRTFDVVTILALLVLNKDFLILDQKIQHKTYLVLGILFCCFTIISGLHSEFGFATYYDYYPILTIFIFIRFLFIYCNHSTKQQWLALNALKKGYVIALAFMTAQLLFGIQISLYSNIGLNVFNEDTGLIRYPGIFSESQFNGQFLAMGSFIFLILKKNIYQKNRYLNYFGFGISVSYLLLAGSRSALGGFIVGMAFLFLLSNIRVKLYGIIVGIISLAALFIVAPDNGIFSRADNLGDDFDFRQSIWAETHEIIKEKPLLGIGLGNFQEYTLKHNQGLYLEISPGEFLYFTQPENGYLKILVEHGGLAFVTFFLFFIIPFYKIAQHIFWQIENKNVLYLIAALGSWLTAFNTVYSLSDYRILLTVTTLLFYLIHGFMIENKTKHYTSEKI